MTGGVVMNAYVYTDGYRYTMGQRMGMGIGRASLGWGFAPRLLCSVQRGRRGVFVLDLCMIGVHSYVLYIRVYKKSERFADYLYPWTCDGPFHRGWRRENGADGRLGRCWFGWQGTFYKVREVDMAGRI